MKTAEEWAAILNDNNQSGSIEEISVRVIKQIQLDAMKEGMRMAATEAMGRYADVQTSAPKLKREINQAILTAAEQLTEKDL